MNELINKLKHLNFNNIGIGALVLNESDIKEGSKIIREWCGKKAEELSNSQGISCGYKSERIKYAKKILGLSEPTTEELVTDWFKESDGEYTSGKAWRSACGRAMVRIVEEQIKKRKE